MTCPRNRHRAGMVIHDPTSAVAHLASAHLRWHGREGPIVRLVFYLVACGKARGGTIRPCDQFQFWTEAGQPDLQGARRFAEAIRAQFIDDVDAHRLGIRQTGHCVTVRMILLDESDPEDALRPARTSW